MQPDTLPDDPLANAVRIASHPSLSLASGCVAPALQPAPAALEQRIGQLRLALRDACELLEGWVAWKCPRQHKREHLAKIEALRAIASATPGESPDHDPEDGSRINWLEANVNLAVHGHCRVGDAVDEFEVLDPDGDLAGTGPTLRAAIDDARGLPT